ncbi:DHA2 family efflux MFS transporter permease subunit [Ralstonia nicotianae]
METTRRYRLSWKTNWIMKASEFDRTQKWVLILTSIATLMAMLDAMVVATATSAIRADLGASLSALQWTMNAYNLSLAALLMTGAALGDRFGRRRVFVTGLCVFVAASIACALARSAEWLIAARVVQGAGGALVTPLSMALLSAAFPPERRGKALGLFGGITGLALILGPVLGGVIAGNLPWQWIFWLNVPIGLPLIVLAVRRIPDSKGPAAALDIPGALLVMGASIGLVWGLMRGSSKGWSDSEAPLALVVGAAFMICFVLWERRAKHPMIPMRLFASRVFSSGIAACFLFYAGMYGVVFFLPQFFQSAQGHDPFAAGLRLLPWTVTLFFIAPLAGSMVDRIGERSVMVTGLLLQAIGFAWIAWAASPGTSYLNLVAPLVISGAGISMAGPAAQKAVLGAVTVQDIGKASGVFNMFRILGGATGIAIAVVAFSVWGNLGSEKDFSEGFAHVMGVCAVLSMAAVLSATRQPTHRAATAAQSANP